MYKTYSSEHELTLAPQLLHQLSEGGLLRWKHKHLAETSSTMQSVETKDLRNGECLLVTTDWQQNGRGQRGNTWESERAMNLTFSLAFCPEFLLAKEQFLLSEIAALAVVECLQLHTPHEIHKGFKIKWPNDVYFQDKKIAGMLLEHNLRGSKIMICLVGIGININQDAFFSDAPNPISLRQITRQIHSRAAILESWITIFNRRYTQIARGDRQVISDDYHRLLYRAEAAYPYQDMLTGEFFQAKIEQVLPNGTLQLRCDRGELRSYDFKEVRFILPADLTH